MYYALGGSIKYKAESSASPMPRYLNAALRLRLPGYRASNHLGSTGRNLLFLGAGMGFWSSVTSMWPRSSFMHVKAFSCDKPCSATSICSLNLLGSASFLFRRKVSIISNTILSLLMLGNSRACRRMFL